MPEVVRFGSADEFSVEVARRFLGVLQQLQAEGRTPQVVLTGGGIASQIYQEVAAQAPDVDVDWTSVDFWWGDERYLDRDADERNAQQARRELLHRVGATRIHEMPSTNSACSVDEAARAYAAEVSDVASAGFDLTLLSMGPDGHVASLFPGSSLLDDHEHLAVGVIASPKPPAERITLTLDALNRSERIWLFAVDSGPGGAKEEAFGRVLANDPAIPATRVHGVAETIWFVS